MTYCKGGERREEKVEGSDYMNLIHTTMHHHACILYILHRCTFYIVVHFTSLYIVHLCTLYTFVHCTSLYILHRCTLYTFVHCTSLYTYIFIHTTHPLLYNETKHSYIYVPSGRPNHIFCGHSWVARCDMGSKKLSFLN